MRASGKKASKRGASKRGGRTKRAMGKKNSSKGLRRSKKSRRIARRRSAASPKRSTGRSLTASGKTSKKKTASGAKKRLSAKDMAIPPMGAVCMVRRADNQMDGSCGAPPTQMYPRAVPEASIQGDDDNSRSRPQKRKAAESAEKINYNIAHGRETDADWDGSREKFIKKQRQSKSPDVIKRMDELQQHAPQEFKDLPAIVLDREKMPIHGLNYDTMMERLGDTSIENKEKTKGLMDAMGVKHVVKNDKGEILGVVGTIPRSPHQRKYPKKYSEPAKKYNQAKRNELKEAYNSHIHGVVIDEAYPISIGGHPSHNSYALVPHPESDIQGGSLNSVGNLKEGEHFFYAFSGKATDDHEAKRKAFSEKVTQTTSSGQAGDQEENHAIPASDVSRRSLDDSKEDGGHLSPNSTKPGSKHHAIEDAKTFIHDDSANHEVLLAEALPSNSAISTARSGGGGGASESER
ncbi:hypothetical protein HDU67_009894, partial [Dinochytrium kinnereticum]